MLTWHNFKEGKDSFLLDNTMTSIFWIHTFLRPIIIIKIITTNKIRNLNQRIRMKMTSSEKRSIGDIGCLLIVLCLSQYKKINKFSVVYFMIHSTNKKKDTFGENFFSSYVV